MLSEKLGYKTIYIQFYNMHMYRKYNMHRRKYNTMLTVLVSEQCNYRKYLFYYFHFIFSAMFMYCLCYEKVHNKPSENGNNSDITIVTTAIFATHALLLSAAFQVQVE